MKGIYLVLIFIFSAFSSFSQNYCRPQLKCPPKVTVVNGFSASKDAKIAAWNNECTTSTVYGIQKSRVGSHITYTAYSGQGSPLYQGGSKAEMLNKITECQSSKHGRDAVYLNFEGYSDDEITSIESSCKVNMKQINREIEVNAITEETSTKLLFSSAERKNIRKGELSIAQRGGQNYHKGSVDFEIARSECAVTAFSRSKPKASGFITSVYNKLFNKKVTVSDIINKARKEILTQYGQNDALFIEFTNELQQSFLVEITPRGTLIVLKNTLCPSTEQTI